MAHIIHDFMHYNRSMHGNLAERMQAILPTAEWELLQRVAKAAAAMQLPLYAVGGLPRDILLGNASQDLDLVVEGRAEQLATALADQYGGRVVVHRAFGTAKWEVPGSRPRRAAAPKDQGAVDVLDFITARSETYKRPGALPTVAPGTIADDLHRRDFTINAIAVRLDGVHLGEVRDDLGGGRDLELGLVRVLHRQSFMDDPTRMYRAVRYEQRYGFQIADETLGLLAGGRQGIQALSGQRVRHELDLILDEPKAREMLRRLAELDLLAPIHPRLGYDEAAARRLAAADHSPPLAAPAVPRRGLRWLLWLMGPSPEEIESVNARLHFTAPLLRDLLGASRLRAEVESLVGLPPSGWDEHLKSIPPASTYAVYLVLPPGLARSALEKYLSEWRHIRPGTTGHDLQRMGIKPGVEYQRILGELRRAWLDGDIKSPEQEQVYLHQILHG